MREKIIKILLGLLILFVLPFTICYGKSQGEVTNYLVTINTKSNGVLQIAYNLKLNVLQDTDFILVEMYNNNFTCIYKAKNIKSVEKDGNYAKIIFNKTISSGSSVDVVFEVNQQNMYRLDEKKQIATYKFEAGKIKDFELNNVKIKWDLENVTYSSAEGTEGQYRIWNKSNSFFQKKRYW